jgi:hypothetical protein
MGWNGSGIYSRIHNWVQDNLAGIDILPDRHDAEDDSIAAGINNCIAKDGQNSPSAALPMAGFRHTNVGAAAARTDYAQVAQVQDGAYLYALATGSAGAYTVNLSPAVTALVAGQVIRFKANHSNSGAATLAINGIAAKNIVLTDGTTALSGGEIAGDAFVEVIYDGTAFRLTALKATAFGRDLLDATDAADARTTLALGTSAVKNTGTSGDAVPVLNGAATTWAASITVSGSGLGDYLIARSSDAGSSAGPDLILDRDSGSAAASDNIGVLKWRGNDDGGATELYAQVLGKIVDPTAASEDGALGLGTVIAGSFDTRLWVGAGTYAEGQTDPGAGKANFADVQIAGLSLGWTYTAQTATTSGTTVELTAAIPAGATEIEILFNGVSTDTANQPPLIQLGDAGGYETSGYVGISASIDSTNAVETAVTDGFSAARPGIWAAANVLSGTVQLARWATDEHIWVASGTTSSATEIHWVSGTKTTSQALTSIRLTTTGGAAVFDAGEARVRYR